MLTRDPLIVQEGLFDRLRDACTHYGITFNFGAPHVMPTDLDFDDLIWQIDRMDEIGAQIVKSGLAFIFELNGRQYGCRWNDPYTLGTPLQVYSNAAKDPNAWKHFAVEQWSETELKPIRVVPARPAPQHAVAAFKVPTWYTHVVRNLPDRDEIRRVFEFKGNLYTVGIGAVEERWLIQIPDGPILTFDDWRMAYPPGPVKLRDVTDAIDVETFDGVIAKAQPFLYI